LPPNKKKKKIKKQAKPGKDTQAPEPGLLEKLLSFFKSGAKPVEKKEKTARERREGIIAEKEEAKGTIPAEAEAKEGTKAQEKARYKKEGKAAKKEQVIVHPEKLPEGVVELDSIAPSMVKQEREGKDYLLEVLKQVGQDYSLAVVEKESGSILQKLGGRK